MSSTTVDAGVSISIEACSIRVEFEGGVRKGEGGVTSGVLLPVPLNAREASVVAVALLVATADVEVLLLSMTELEEFEELSGALL